MAREVEKLWIHGLTAILVSLVLLVFSSSVKYGGPAGDLVVQILNIPEYPVLRIREFSDDLALRFKSRNELFSMVKVLQEENIRLRNILNISEAQAEILRIEAVSKESARVTFRPPSSWWSECRINMGARDGIAPGQLVLSEGALVGRVAGVENGYSWVELITSTSILIPAVVEETREIAVVAGDGNGGIWLLYLPEKTSADVGMTVSTAIVNDMSPPGIPIGRISSKEEYYLGGTRAWPLHMEADLSRLYKVNILPYGRESK